VLSTRGFISFFFHRHKFNILICDLIVSNPLLYTKLAGIAVINYTVSFLRHLCHNTRRHTNNPYFHMNLNFTNTCESLSCIQSSHPLSMYVNNYYVNIL
jgi:hypothetical protein